MLRYLSVEIGVKVGVPLNGRFIRIQTDRRNVDLVGALDAYEGPPALLDDARTLN